MSHQTRGARIQAAIMLAIGLALLGGAATAFYFSRSDSLMSSYNSAPQCPSLADAAAGQSCRFTATATVTQITGEGDGVTVVAFEFPGPYNPYFSGRLPVGVQPDSSIGVGSTVRVEVWGLRVTKLGDLNTVDNPASDPTFAHLPQIALLLALFGVIAVGWAVVRTRNVSDPGAPSMRPIATSDAIFHH